MCCCDTVQSILQHESHVLSGLLLAVITVEQQELYLSMTSQGQLVLLILTTTVHVLVFTTILDLACQMLGLAEASHMIINRLAKGTLLLFAFTCLEAIILDCFLLGAVIKSVLL